LHAASWGKCDRVFVKNYQQVVGCINTGFMWVLGVCTFVNE
jgi:hypothetical protein